MWERACSRRLFTYRSRSRIRVILVNRLDSRQHFVGKLQLETRYVAIQLLKRRGADDVTGHERLRRHECQRHLRRVQTVFTGQCYVRSEEHTSELQSLRH